MPRAPPPALPQRRRTPNIKLLVGYNLGALGTLREFLGRDPIFWWVNARHFLTNVAPHLWNYPSVYLVVPPNNFHLSRGWWRCVVGKVTWPPLRVTDRRKLQARFQHLVWRHVAQKEEQEREQQERNHNDATIN